MNSSTVIHFKPILVSVSVLVGFTNLTWPLKRWVDCVHIKYVKYYQTMQQDVMLQGFCFM